MTWVLEEPIYIIILGVVLMLFLGYALMQTGYRALFHALLAVAALTVGLLILEQVVQTDKEQVEAALEEMARDVEANDHEAIFAHIYSGAPELLKRAKREVLQYTFEDVDIKNNVEIQFVEGERPRKALVSFNVVVDVDYMGMHHRRAPSFIEVTLIMEDGKWRVAEFSHDESRVLGH